MDISGRRFLVLGGFGLVGSAVCRELIEQGAAHLVISSLYRHEAEEAVEELTRLYPGTGLEPAWGNIFVGQAFKDLSRNDLLGEPETRRQLLEDIFSELDEAILSRQALYRLITETRPDGVVDCINTATALAYQNVYAGSRDVLLALEAGAPEAVAEATYRLVASQYTPQLIRHVQVLYGALREAGSRMYVKVGTTGTGGMGLNIPFTHSEERPSRVLLSKSAVAGAHSMLLFLMGRTPDGPITKEIKPAAVIAWKRVAKGAVQKGGRAVPLWDVPLEQATPIGSEWIGVLPEAGFRRLGKDRVLESSFVDTGENGMFSLGEFSVITTVGQMEFVTPEEIAQTVVAEIKGGNTGFDIVAALDGSVMGSTYRAGVLREKAISALREMERIGGKRSVAFELLGPPRLSKLLYEAEIVRRTIATLPALAESDADELANRALELLAEDEELRSTIISIGIPIMLPDGRLLRGPMAKIPPIRGDQPVPVPVDRIDAWAEAGWVDLRPANLQHWKNRASRIIAEVDAQPPEDSSSRFHHDRYYWALDRELDIGKVVAWIFIREDRGERMK